MLISVKIFVVASRRADLHFVDTDLNIPECIEKAYNKLQGIFYYTPCEYFQIIFDTPVFLLLFIIPIKFLTHTHTYTAQAYIYKSFVNAFAIKFSELLLLSDGLVVINLHFEWIGIKPPIPVVARSKSWVCGRSLTGIVVSNPAGDMAVCLLCVVM
jgi:hypothetical protein